MLNPTVKITHCTSVHPRNDTRIYGKMCQSLAADGYDISLIVADGLGNECINGVDVIDIGKPRSRLDRVMRLSNIILDRALLEDSEIYHLHDPELIFLGLKLKKKGKRVVFDSHEDFPKQLLTKDYLWFPIRWIFAKVFKAVEAYSCRKFDFIITATPHIKDKFLNLGARRVVDINNFPIIGELYDITEERSWNERSNAIAYVGAISSLRGMRQVVSAFGKVKYSTRLKLVGDIREKELHEVLKNTNGWRAIDQIGMLNRSEVRSLLSQCIGGIVTFLAAPNHINSQPNKMFEYMSAGIPVISSNFPFWREIIEGNNCGLCVNPTDTTAIAEAIDFLSSNPGKAEEMGRNGLKAVLKSYNWELEYRKLPIAYAQCLDDSQHAKF